MVAKGNSVEDKNKILVETIKNNFIQTDEKLTLTIYIKDVKHEHTVIEFTETQIRTRFKTTDVSFLQQHKCQEPDTLFEWCIDLTNRINPMQCKYIISKFKIEMDLYKHESASGKWSELIKMDKKDIHQVNAKEVSTKTKEIRSPSSSVSPPARMADKLTMKQPANNYSSDFYGFTGLQNLGNTCYMNAALQCLINLTDLRDYFIETPNIFQKEINQSNALGLNGKLAISFALLLRKLWKSNSSYISPNNLRDLICTKYAHFRGYEQQDTQEFMCSLLSILHEDLNRVLKKPFYENNLECNIDSIESTSKVAHDSWQRFLTRENSFITDNFYGQFKSKLTCPVCAKVSITFEPFSNLLMPLPSPKQAHICIFITKERQPMKIKLYFREDETADEVLKALKNRFENFRNKSLSMFVLNQKLVEWDDEMEVIGFEFGQAWENIAGGSKIPKLKNSQVFIIYEIDDDANVQTDQVLELRVQQVCKYPTLNPNILSQCACCKKLPTEPKSNTDKPVLSRCTRCYRSAYCNAECQKKDWPRHSLNTCCKPLDVVGLPFVLTFTADELSNTTDFEETLRNKMFEMSTLSTEIFNTDEKALKKFEIDLVTDTKTLKGTKKISANDLLDIFNDRVNQSRSIINLQMKWNNTWNNNNNNEHTKINQLKIVTNLEALTDLTRSGVKEANTNLNDCMGLFTEPETLTNENPWYCSNCKEHQKARKQMSLWKLSKYFIITLKRFHAHKASDAAHTSNTYLNYLIQNRLAYNKLNTFIEYPLRNLDMSQYISDPANTTKYSYDLCGVINHIGQSLYLGHYTAFSRTHDRNDSTKDELGWRLFDDSHVQSVTNLEHLITQDAYVLVYRLRDDQSSTPGAVVEPSKEPVAELGVSSLNTPQTSEDEYFNLNSDESVELNSNASSESLDVQLDVNKLAFTNLNDID